ncbi:MAG TPA: hypothetical protein VN828_16460, partial [Acidobacteriaceae bacterium]|nr:hypothetical protein [Acidobacteriaceae bacterium]
MAVTLLLWLGDWTVWRIRVWRGGGYDTVQVNQILLIPLKNHKMEADAQSTADQLVCCTLRVGLHFVILERDQQDLV